MSTLPTESYVHPQPIHLFLHVVHHANGNGEIIGCVLLEPLKICLGEFSPAQTRGLERVLMYKLVHELLPGRHVRQLAHARPLFSTSAFHPLASIGMAPAAIPVNAIIIYCEKTCKSVTKVMKAEVLNFCMFDNNIPCSFKIIRFEGGGRL